MKYEREGIFLVRKGTLDHGKVLIFCFYLPGLIFSFNVILAGYNELINEVSLGYTGGDGHNC